MAPSRSGKAATTYPSYLRTAEVADLLHVSPKTVSRWAKEGKLPFLKTLGGHRRYPEAEIRDLVTELRERRPPRPQVQGVRMSDLVLSEPPGWSHAWSDGSRAPGVAGDPAAWRRSADTRRGEPDLAGVWCSARTSTRSVWPRCGKIDVMENFGKDPTVVHGTVHGPGYAASTARTAAFDAGIALADDFHTPSEDRRSGPAGAPRQDAYVQQTWLLVCRPSTRSSHPDPAPAGAQGATAALVHDGRAETLLAAGPHSPRAPSRRAGAPHGAFGEGGALVRHRRRWGMGPCRQPD